MKKNLLFLAVLMFTLTAGAQTVVTQRFTEARMPQVWVEPAVKPLVCEVEVLKDKDNYKSYQLTKDDVNSLNNDLKNIQNWGIFKWTEEEKCDMIVAATFNFIGDGNSFTLEIKGFPAKFANWRTARQDDYEWMKIPGSYYLNGRTLDPVVKDPK